MVLRNIRIEVCDLNNTPIKVLFDSNLQFENCIHSIVKTDSRNGSKELSFVLYNREHNTQWEDLEAARYLIPEYRIRLEDDNGEDYYLLTSDSIQHNNISKNINIKVKHISCLLKYQAMDLEFSDDYGNNVGTIQQLCETILAETDWTYDDVGSAKFYEKDGITEKYRTLNASVKTGAFSLLTKAADLFDAKLIFDGAEKKVKALPMNPFSIDKSTGLPDFRYASNTIEINYGINAKNISRTRDSENIATCLFTYGAYGDNVSKYCGIQDIKYRKYSYTYLGTEQQYCYFVIDKYITGTIHNVYFDTTGCTAGDALEYYMFDSASDLYVWNSTKEIALPTVDECTAQLISPTYEEAPRNFPFLMDFSYYVENEMLTQSQIQTIAEYQINDYVIKGELKELSEIKSEDDSELAKVININNYCKLAATPVNQNNLLYLRLDTSTYQDGIIYHTQDGSVIRKKWFTWRVATAIDDNGNAVNTDASVVYMVSTDATYAKTYIKEITEVDGQKTGLLLWLPFVDRIPVANAGYYLFSANTVSGYLGNCECNIETIKQTLKEQTTYKGIEHPVYFRTTSDTAPAVPTNLEWAWDVVSTKGTYAVWTVYFYGRIFGDAGWIKCMANTRMPLPTDTGYGYWYHISSGGHYRRIEEGGVSKWILIYDTRDTHETKIRNKEVAGEFTSVWQAIARLAKIYNGYNSEYEIAITSNKPAGRYFIKPSVSNLTTDDNIMFSTDYPLVAGDVLVYDSIKGHIYKKDYYDDTSVSVRILSNSVVNWYPSNELDTTDFLDGYINDNGGIETSKTHVRTGTLTLRPNTPYQYITTKPITVYYYDGYNIFISKLVINETGTRTTPAGTRHAKICMEGTIEDLSAITVKRASNTYASYLVYNDEEYNRISTNTTATGYTISLAEGLKNFRTYSDKIYLEDKPAIDAKQAEELALKKTMMESLGSIYRESYKQDSAYVEGDEQKLFDDSLEDLETLSKPTTTYNLEYVDRFLTDENDLCKWEDVDINTAVYLIDDELNIEQWAFVDSIKTCYDEHAKSSITINTSLTKLSQQSFTDVLSNIAKVSEETKSSADIYKRAEALSSTGNLTAEKLEGELYATTVNISGGSSSWTTDEKGNMIFTSADNASAMMLAGSGLLISNKKDEFGRFVWRTAIDGKGINADVVNTGELNAELITAGTITADKLSSVAGEGLDISSNKEVLLFATVSGSRPSGKLEVLRDGGSLVSINSTDGITIASGANVDIAAGNTIDIAGSDVNISGTNVSMTAASTLAMTSSTMNVDSGSINVLSDSTISVKSGGNISVESGGAVSVAGGQSGSGVLINNDGVTVTGEDINLLTNSGTTGKIYLGSNTNYISSAGVLSLHDGDLVLDGADGSLTTKAAMNIAAGGNINLTTDTSTINMSAGEINMSGGKLTADGGAVEIKATSALDITSPNFTVNSTTDEVLVAGKIYASEGQIGCDASRTGGWTISKDRLTSGAGTYNVTLNSDTTIKPEDINEWVSTQAYATGDIVKVTENKVSKYYKAKANSTGMKPGTSAGNPYWEEAEEWFAIWAGGTKAVDSPFRVTRDGSVYLSSLWTVDSNDPSAKATKINLSAAVWKLNYSTIMSNTKDANGTYTKMITLSDSTASRDKEIKFNNVSNNTKDSQGVYTKEIVLSDTTSSGDSVLKFNNVNNNTKDSEGVYTKEITLSDATASGDSILKFNNVSKYTITDNYCTAMTLSDGTTLNFNSAGAIKRYTFYNTGEIEGGIDFSVRGVKEDGTPVIPAIGGQSLTGVMQYHKTGTEAGNITATSYINFQSSGHTTSISSKISEPLTLGAVFDTSSTENRIIATPTALFKSAIITQDTSYNIDLTLTDEHETDTLTVTASMDAPTAGVSTSEVYKADGTEVKNGNNLVVYHRIMKGESTVATDTDVNVVKTELIIDGSSLTPSTTVTTPDSRDLVYNGTTHSVTVNNTINTEAHTLTPNAIIKKGTETVGTITGESKTISTTVAGSGTSASRYALFTGISNYDGTQMSSATVNAYPWAIVSEASGKLRITAQVRSASDGKGSAWAGVNIGDKTITLDASVVLTGASATSKTVSITPTATIDSSVFTGAAINKTIASTLTITGSASTDHGNITTTTTFDGLDATTTSIDIYPQTTVTRRSNTEFRVICRARQKSTSGTIIGQLINDYTITPTITVAATTGGATLTPDTTLGSFSYSGTATTATASETHNIDTSTKIIDITPKVTISGTDYNGSSSYISYTVGLEEQEASTFYRYAGKVTIGGVSTVGPEKEFLKVSVTPIGTSISIPSTTYNYCDGTGYTIERKTYYDYSSVGSSYYRSGSGTQCRKGGTYRKITDSDVGSYAYFGGSTDTWYGFTSTSTLYTRGSSGAYMVASGASEGDVLYKPSSSTYGIIDSSYAGQTLYEQGTSKTYYERQ